MCNHSSEADEVDIEEGKDYLEDNYFEEDNCYEEGNCFEEDNCYEGGNYCLEGDVGNCLHLQENTEAVESQVGSKVGSSEDTPCLEGGKASLYTAGGVDIDDEVL